MKRIALPVASLLLAVSSLTFAQEVTRPVSQDLPPGEQDWFGGIVARLRPDGTMTGNIAVVDPSSLELVPVPGVRMQFLQRRSLIAEGQSDANGRFEVAGLSPRAVYTLVAQGDYQGRRHICVTGVAVLSAESPLSPDAAPLPDPPVDPSASADNRQLHYISARKLVALESLAEDGVGVVLGEYDSFSTATGDFGNGASSAAVLAIGGGGGAGGLIGGAGAGGAAGGVVAAGAAAAASRSRTQVLPSPFRPK